MNENPLISVIIPVYNIEPYIERCIRSVIAQTYKNLEIIVVDDGSTDNGGRICDKIAAEDSRIKVIHQPNNGLSAARNTGIKESHGEYIGFVDGDDFIDSDMYEYLYALISDNHADISFCRFRRYDFPDAWKYNNEEQHGYVVLDGISSIRSFFLGQNSFSTYVWKGLYDKRKLSWFPVGLYIEDYEFIVKVLLRAHVVVSGKEIKYNYCYRPDSIMGGGNFQKIANDFLTISNNLENVLKTTNEPELLHLFYLKNLKLSLGYLSKSLHSNSSGIVELRHLIRTFSSLSYQGRDSWKAKVICFVFAIEYVFPYKVMINISDFVLGIRKRTKYLININKQK